MTSWRGMELQARLVLEDHLRTPAVVILTMLCRSPGVTAPNTAVRTAPCDHAASLRVLRLLPGVSAYPRRPLSCSAGPSLGGDVQTGAPVGPIHVLHVDRSVLYPHLYSLTIRSC